MSTRKALRLIASLKKHPKRFSDKGKAYDLLQEYFKGFPVSSLEELLTHENRFIRKSAAWLTSELAGDAISVAPQILPLLDDGDPYIRYYAYESLVSFSCSGLKGIYHYVVLVLEEQDIANRKLGMFWIVKAPNTKLEEALQHYLNTADTSHVEGLRLLLDGDSSTRDSQVSDMLYSKNNILAAYGAIFIKREMLRHGRKISFDLDSIDDMAVRNFLDEHM